MSDSDPSAEMRVKSIDRTAWERVGVDIRKAIELTDAGLTPETVALVVHVPGSDNAKTLGALYCDGLLTIADVKEALTGLYAAAGGASTAEPSQQPRSVQSNGG